MAFLASLPRFLNAQNLDMTARNQDQSTSMFSLNGAGLVALADLPTVARRTALTGTSGLADALILCPGFHRQQDAPHLNRGEHPACAAMTTSYVFRIENQATVHYLQAIGRPGQLTSLSVENTISQQSAWARLVSQVYDFHGASLFATFAYAAAVMSTIITLGFYIFLEDWWGVAVLSVFIFARYINIIVVRRRATMGWKGEPEPDQKSDLIILASQDRWIRMRGAVDDVKAVTSGEWLREPTLFESATTATATLLVYLNIALVGNMNRESQILLVMLLFASAGLLGLANARTASLRMYGRTIRVDGPREVFKRRLQLTWKLVKETNTSDWAVQLGMAQRSDIEVWKKEHKGEGSRILRRSKTKDHELVIL